MSHSRRGLQFDYGTTGPGVVVIVINVSDKYTRLRSPFVSVRMVLKAPVEGVRPALGLERNVTRPKPVDLDEKKDVCPLFLTYMPYSFSMSLRTESKTDLVDPLGAQ